MVQLWFRVSQQWATGGVLVKECTDVRIAGLHVDYDPPAHYQGEVVALRGGAMASTGGGGGMVRMVRAVVRTDPGFPEPHEYIAQHTGGADPSDNYMNAPAIWPKHIGYGCNRTLGCPGHGAAVLEPTNASLPAHDNDFMLLASAEVRGACTRTAVANGRVLPPQSLPFIRRRCHCWLAAVCGLRSAGYWLLAGWLATTGCWLAAGCWLLATGCCGSCVVRRSLLATRRGGCASFCPRLAKVGDKITISMRKGITWHVQNSTRVSSTNITIHGASLFGLSEFDGGGG